MQASLYNNSVFKHTTCILPDQLRLYCGNKLRGKGLRAVEEHLAGCELCSAAADGFLLTAVTAADLSQLNRSIDSAAGANWFGIWRGRLILSLAVLTLVSAGIWLLNEKKETKPFVEAACVNSSGALAKIIDSATPPVQSLLQDAKKSEPGIEIGAYNENHSDEKFIQPLLRKAGSSERNSSAQAFNADNYVNSNNIAKPGGGGGNVVSDNNSTTATDPTNENVNSDDLILPEYNSPVQYIHSLKVSEYNELYFNNKGDAVFPGTPAPQEGKQSSFGNELFAEPVRTQRADLVLNEGLLYFRSADYLAALDKFRLLLDLNTKDINSLFYTGLCYYSLKQPDKSIMYLDRVLTSGNNAFREEALWYKAQAWLLRSDQVNAKDILQVIVKERGFYAKQAKEKLKELN